MGRKLSMLFLCFTIIFGACLPLERGLAASNVITIAADTVNVRKGPSLSYQLVKQVKKGEKFTIVNEKDDWIEIELSLGKTGWVANWLVTKNMEEVSAVRKNSVAVSNADQLRVRSGPGTSFRVIGLLNKGQAVTVVDQNENWLKVATTFGDGWVSRQYVSIKKSNVEPKEKNNSNGIGTGVVTALLNVRNQPSTTGTIVGKLTKGETITVYSKQNDWLEIRFSGKTAWVSSDYVKFGTDVETKNRTIGTVTASKLSVRSSASMNSNIVGTITMGKSFTIIEEANNWVKIEYQPKKYGWAAGWYFNINKTTNSQAVKESKITILHNGTNIRKKATVQSDILLRVNEGETFDVKKVVNDWYEIALSNGTSGFIAGWTVSTTGSGPRIEKQGAESYLKHKTIVIDPGHGGVDDGATGANGTREKELTLRTARLLSDKLRAAGATVILTRNSDSFLSLPTRVRTSSVHQADAFISLHYDSNLDRSVRGTTGYYYHSYQKTLATYLHNSTVAQTRLKNRGVRSGNYHVIRENKQKAVLMELGYLSNPDEEMTLNSGYFQENAATGLFNGLAHFFKEKQ